MAKQTRKNKLLRRKPNDDVSVNSRTYGKHTRATRRTKTPAIINDVLAAHTAKTEAINAAKFTSPHLTSLVTA